MKPYGDKINPKIEEGMKLRGEETADSPFQYVIHKSAFCRAEPILIPTVLSTEIGEKWS